MAGCKESQEWIEKDRGKGCYGIGSKIGEGLF